MNERLLRIALALLSENSDWTVGKALIQAELIINRVRERDAWREGNRLEDEAGGLIIAAREEVKAIYARSKINS